MQRFTQLLLFILFALPFWGKAQEWQWAMNHRFFDNALTVDQEGNLFFVNSNNWDSIPYTQPSGLTIYINENGIVKFNTEGNFEWIAEINGLKEIHWNPKLLTSKFSKGITYFLCNSRANVIEKLLFDTILLKAPKNIPGLPENNLFLAACDSNGKWIFAKWIAKTGSPYLSLKEDNEGNLIIGLDHNSQTIAVNEIHTFPIKGNDCYWLGKFKIDGEMIWGKSFCNDYNDTSKYLFRAHTVDRKGNIFLYGEVMTKSSKHALIKLDKNGIEVKRIYISAKISTNWVENSNLVCDSLGNVYFGGNVKGKFDLGNGIVVADTFDIILAKFDSTLNLQWVKKPTGNGNFEDIVRKIAIDDSANIYFTGKSKGIIDFNGIMVNTDPIDTTFNSKNAGSVILAKYSTVGVAKWAYSPASMGFSYGQRVLLDDCGNIYSQGIFYPPFSASNQPKKYPEITFGKYKTKSNLPMGTFLAKYSQRLLKIKQVSRCVFDSLTAIADVSFNTFKWQFSNGQILNGKKVIFIADSAGWYKVKLTAATAKGCIQHTEDSFYFALPVTQKDDPVIFYATVNSPSSAKIEFKNIPTAENYHIYRSNSGSNFQKIASTTNSFFEDNTTDCNKHSYTYKVTAEDRCGNIVNSSNLAKTILLQGENHKNQFAFLNWSPYEVWQQGVKEYCIETKDSSGGWKALICSQSTKMEDPAFVEEGQSERCYRIRATENNGNNHYSISNELCLPYTPTIWIPNAFSPNGDKLNDTFKILTLGISEFKLTIYNRWGEEVFITENIKNSWNGKTGNEKLPEGVYLYILKAKGINKENIYKSGSVLLMR